jgi:branched-chain amino acid transport system permease protein
MSALAIPARRRDQVSLSRASVRLAAAAVALAATAALPLIVGNFYTGILVSVVVNACVFLSITVLTGYVGQISLGQASLMGVGAYISALLTNRLGIPVFAAVPLAGLGTIPFSMIIGLPALRLRGLQLAVVTLLFTTTMASVVFRNPDVIQQVTQRSLTSADSIAGVRLPQAAWSGQLLSNRAYYWVALTFLIGLMVLVRNVRRGRVGRVLIATRESEETVAAAGSSVVRAKLTAFAISAFCAGVGGSLFGHFSGQVSWVDFDTFRSIFFFALAALAGLDSIPGAVLAAALLILPPEIFSGASNLESTTFLVAGAMLVVVILWLPQGVMRSGPVLAAALRRRGE